MQIAPLLPNTFSALPFTAMCENLGFYLNIKVWILLNPGELAQGKELSCLKPSSLCVLGLVTFLKTSKIPLFFHHHGENCTFCRETVWLSEVILHNKVFWEVEVSHMKKRD